MQWYITKLIFQILSGEGQHQIQFDEQLRLLRATDWHEALLKAHALGTREECHFQNHQKQWVQWKFIHITELTCLGQPKDGQELHYQITEPEDVELYLRKIQRQALSVGTNPLTQAS
jgi:Domain of unknown function (DUF4288)